MKKENDFLWTVIILFYSTALQFSISLAEKTKIFQPGHIYYFLINRIQYPLSETIMTMIYFLLIILSILLLGKLWKESFLKTVKNFYVKLFLSISVGLIPMWQYYLAVFIYENIIPLAF